MKGDGSDEKRSVAPESVDLDGDGVSDLLACEPSSGGRGLISPLLAISGKDRSIAMEYFRSQRKIDQLHRCGL